MKEIYFAGGCFWGLQRYFDLIDGVITTEVGYINGNKQAPKYRDVCKGSGHAEAVHIIYNPQIITLKKLLNYYYNVINPTTYQKQGNDEGIQYRTGIYYTNKKDVKIIIDSLEKLQELYLQPIVVEVQYVNNFTKAEEYHQKFLEKNPFGYCHISKETLKTVEIESYNLSQNDYEIIKGYKQEPAYKNKYYNLFEKGIYVDIQTKKPLFSSKDKYNSETGWPSFTKTINEKFIIKKLDFHHLMFRIELLSKENGNHLGYLFNDGPKEKGGKRYCINSAAIKFIPKEKMKEQGYENYLKYID